MEANHVEFLRIAFRDDPQRRQTLLLDFFRSTQLCGLHYLVNTGNGNIVAIRRPDCTLHSTTTEYLRSRAHRSINTRIRLAEDLKKVADFALVCGVEIGDGRIPLKLFLRGLAEYVKVLSPDLGIAHRSEWTTMTRVPLHPLFRPGTTVLPGVRERDGIVPQGMSRSTVYSVVRTAIHLCDWLRRRFPEVYSHLNAEFEELPTKTGFNTKTIRAGTSRPASRTVIDVPELAGIFDPALEERALSPNELLTTADMVELYSVASKNRTTRDVLVLAFLEGWGLRRGALSNLSLAPGSIPRLGTGQFSVHQEMQMLKDQLRGDLIWVNFPNGGRWTIVVQDHGNLRPDTQLKRARGFLLTYEYDNAPFTDRLYSWLLERQGTLEHAGVEDHGRLFVSLSDSSLGQPLNGRGITKLFERLVDDVKETTGRDLRLDPHGQKRRVSPHTVRHYYATTELTVNKRTDVETARRLLHAPGNVETVQDIYYHLMPRDQPASSPESVLQLWQKLDRERKGGWA